MPQDQQKRQKAVMKKRSKHKSHKSYPQAPMPFTSQSMIRRARDFPIHECWISSSWEKTDPGLVQIIVSREQPDGDICFGVYLVDKLCLGLKNTFARSGYSPASYQAEASRIFSNMESVPCPIELAHQMIYASIEYAARFGFTPEKDYALSQYMLAPRGELEEPYNLTFGKDGKPFFIAGPRDNAPLIIEQLERTAGPGNYDYIAMIGEF